MNLLLWRSEYGERSGVSSAVPPTLVWRKILNAPDDSALNVLYRGQRIGYCHMQTGVSGEFSSLEEAPRQGVKAVNRVRIDGSFSIPEKRGRFRFEADLSLSEDRKWERFKLRVVRRPVEMEIQSEAATELVRVTVTDNESQFERTFTASEFKNPMSLLEGLVDPVAGGLMGGIPAEMMTTRAAADEPLLVWEAREDTLTIAHQSVRVYRLETRVLERYPVAVFVSRAGEILKVELPGGILLVHDRIRIN